MSSGATHSGSGCFVEPVTCGLRHTGYCRAYAFHGINFGVWIRISAEVPLRTFILYDKASKSVYEFTSDLAEGVSLTSTTGRSAFLFPLPFGCFMQSFPKANPDELWKAHLEGEVYIVEKLGIPLAGSEWPFLELLSISVPAYA